MFGIINKYLLLVNVNKDNIVRYVIGTSFSNVLTNNYCNIYIFILKQIQHYTYKSGFYLDNFMTIYNNTNLNIKKAAKWVTLRHSAVQ